MSKYGDQIKNFYPDEAKEATSNSITMLDSKRASLDGAIGDLILIHSVL